MSKRRVIQMVPIECGISRNSVVSRELYNEVMEYVQQQVLKYQCCLPYDCMHHELCEGEGQECGRCARLRVLYESTTRLGRTLLHNPSNISFYFIEKAARQDIDSERIAFYRENRHSETATHWSDEADV
jgi:hypothetical protein